MSTDSYFVTAIIPVLNGEAFVRDAIDSILEQDYQPLEILVIDGGSTDKTKEIVLSYGDPVHFVSQYPEHRLGAARNVGVRQAKGNVISFLDADDLWSPDKLQLQLTHLANDSSTDIVLGLTQKMQITGVQNGKMQFKNWANPELALSMGSASFRRTVFDAVGPFDEEQPFACDWDWFMRAREQGIKMRTHQETVQYYRRHGGNMTEEIDEGNHDTLVMLKKSLKRRRQGSQGQATSLPLLQSITPSRSQEKEQDQ